ncbi:MAG: hypothetical protein C0425_09085 [Chlorobiaceae bacterium]|nr:hypothetical protein [Chlorobiaceae bacterium]MBA4310477.1 hypothetical protein [Chlorobiaceae bacterium]
MFEILKKLFYKEESSTEINSERKFSSDELQIATCALLIEIANADFLFSDEERGNVISMMKNIFSLNENEVSDLIELSEKKINDSVSIFEFTSIMNEKLNQQEKFELLKNFWRLVLIDNKLDSLENHLMKKIGATLNVSHQDLISAKLLIKTEKGKIT